MKAVTSKLLTRASLHVTLEQETIFVHPTLKPRSPATLDDQDDDVEQSNQQDRHNQSYAQHEPAGDDPLIKGTVVLNLTNKPRSIKRLVVKLQAQADIYGGSDYAYKTVDAFERQLVLELQDQLLDQGQHAFHFSFIYPSSGPVYQRSLYGRVRHRVTATIEFTRTTSSKLTSLPAHVYIVANPALPGELPDPFDRQLEHFSEDLGPIALRLSSPHLTVSSLISVHLSFLSPPKDCTLQYIGLIIVQSFTIIYDNPRKVAKPVPKRYSLGKVRCTAPSVPLRTTLTTSSHLSNAASSWRGVTGGGGGMANGFQLDNDEFIQEQTPLHQLDVGQEYHYSALFRVPNDDYIRPTTLKGTKTNIRVEHRLLVEIRYSKRGGDDRLLSIQRPVEIASCCCLSEYLSLPPYTRETPTNEDLTSTLSSTNITNRRQCLCNSTFTIGNQTFTTNSTATTMRQTFDNLSFARATTIDNEQRSVWSLGSASPQSLLGGTMDLLTQGRTPDQVESRWLRDNKTAPAHVQGMEGRL
ncbi:hypothetical protein OIO90_002362 [Microbotryomycetes sp. JL221]|nr:hypothetical protein OIO90_002362 [Microbotryomycetes sp. JL221]